MYKMLSASIFFTILFCFITGKTTAQQKDSLLSQLSRKWIDAKIYTLKMAELMAEELAYNILYVGW